MKHKRETWITVGILLILFGIVSFLIPLIQHWLTLVFLLVGAGLTVKFVWFWK